MVSISTQPRKMKAQKVQRKRRPFSSLSSSFGSSKSHCKDSLSNNERKTRSPPTLTKSTGLSDRTSEVDVLKYNTQSRTPPSSSSGVECWDSPADGFNISYTLSLQGDTPRDGDDDATSNGFSSTGSSSFESFDLSLQKISEDGGESKRLSRHHSFSPRADQFMLKISNMCTKMRNVSSETQQEDVSSDGAEYTGVRGTQGSPFTSFKKMRKREDLPNSSDEEEFCAMVKSLSGAVKEEYSCKQEEIDQVVLEATSPALSRKSERRLHRSDSVESREMSSVSSEKRRNVYLEILNTEKNFIADLQKLVAVCILLIFSSFSLFLLLFLLFSPFLFFFLSRSLV